MGIVLSGIEIDNFKSYSDKQYIRFSDLSVLLGANSSGKSTALQALLVMKQTIECNSPDEELLLSGKYVALGDYDDVISDIEKDFFSLAVVLNQTEHTEKETEGDFFKISWFFSRASDGISAALKQVKVVYENLVLSFLKSEDGLYHMYINDKRSPFSARINNLIINSFVIHYDVELNTKAVELLNEMSKILISKKTTTIATDKPISIDGIQEFYFKLLDRIQEREEAQGKNVVEKSELANRLRKTISAYGDLITPRHEEILKLFPDEFYLKVLEIALSGIDDLDNIEQVVARHEMFISNYNLLCHPVQNFEGRYIMKSDPFRNFGKDSGKEDNLTQLKYALDFYKAFLANILSKLFFVGPIRETPKGLYNIGFETIPKYVGPSGSYFASVLLHENKKEREYILPGRIEKCTLSEALAEWMIHLNVASSVNVDKKNSFGFSVSIENMEQVKSDIMNVGIGTSQVLPVLISVLLSEPNEIMVFEQPELHLHPFSQSRLADMFTEFCKHGRKIILETHSEYFLLRLRYHIVKENFLNSMTAVNFFQNFGGTKVSSANISGFGNIDYPDDFRDETQELLNAIMEAALDRKGLS